MSVFLALLRLWEPWCFPSQLGSTVPGSVPVMTSWSSRFLRQDRSCEGGTMKRWETRSTETMTSKLRPAKIRLLRLIRSRCLISLDHFETRAKTCAIYYIMYLQYGRGEILYDFPFYFYVYLGIYWPICKYSQHCRVVKSRTSCNYFLRVQTRNTNTHRSGGTTCDPEIKITN